MIVVGGRTATHVVTVVIMVIMVIMAIMVILVIIVIMAIVVIMAIMVIMHNHSLALLCIITSYLLLIVIMYYHVWSCIITIIFNMIAIMAMVQHHGFMKGNTLKEATWVTHNMDSSYVHKPSQTHTAYSLVTFPDSSGDCFIHIPLFQVLPDY